MISGWIAHLSRCLFVRRQYFHDELQGGIAFRRDMREMRTKGAELSDRLLFCLTFLRRGGMPLQYRP